MHKKITTPIVFPLLVTFYLGLALLPLKLSATALEEVRVLADMDLSGLALRMLDKDQPLFTQDVAKWSQWESLRYEILEREGNYQQLVNRYDILPKNIPRAFQLSSATQAAQSWLKLKNGHSARRILREAIWAQGSDTSAPLPEAQLAEWSELSVRSYLVDDLVNDAQLSARIFLGAYGKSRPQADELYVRALIQGGKQEEAGKYLSSTKGKITKSVRLLIDLRSGKVDTKKLMTSATRAANKKGIDDLARLELLLVAADAANRIEHYSSRLKFLEKAVAISGGANQADKVFVVTADTLWNAYHEYAEHMGNKSGLLIGDDDKWFAKGINLSGKNKIRARAIFAFLANKGSTVEIRQASHTQFSSLTSGVKGRYELLKQLYLNSSWYYSEKDLPVAVRSVIASEALRNSDVSLASRMLAGMESSNTKEKGELSNIRRARIHIMAGHFQTGVELLDEALVFSDLNIKKNTDMLVQVIFDLQNAGQHAQAFGLFDKILNRLKDMQHKREILFWMADSQKETDNYEEAARLYLKSALLDNPKARDPWADSARYHAATVLGEAGLNADARKIYQDMLKYTKDLGRRKVLQREMRQLQMKQ